MYIVDTNTNEKIEVDIKEVDAQDYNTLTVERYFFKWKDEKSFKVYKLILKEKPDILGLISLDFIDTESRIEIRLLAVSIENRGKNKLYDRIVGCLIGFAARKAILKYPKFPCISLVPKTELRTYYKDAYFMMEGGKSVFCDGINLIKLAMKYE